MKQHSLKHAILLSCATSVGLTFGQYMNQDTDRWRYNPGNEAMFSRGNSGVRQAQRKAKKLRNVRARSSK